jgi:hypothetical protein
VSTGFSTFDVGDCGCGPTCTPVCLWLPSGLCGTCAERTLTLTGNIAFGGQPSWLMTYSGGGVWTTPAITLGTDTGQITFTNFDSFWAAASVRDAWVPSGNGASDPLHDSTCSPIHMHAVTGPGGFGNWLFNHGVTDIYIDDSLPSVPASCYVMVTAQGCNGMPVPGATVDVYVGATLVDSLTTNTAGQVSFDPGILGPPNTSFTTKTSKSRFVTDTTNFDIATDGLNLVVNLGPAAGYECIGGCGSPLADTIHATFSTAGLVTLTYAAGVWTASDTIAGQAYVFTFNGTGWTITRNGVDCGAGWGLTSCPTSFLGTLTIPAGACATELGSTCTVTE